jgi:endonuclease YncB( thermonuclease family)
LLARESVCTYEAYPYGIAVETLTVRANLIHMPTALNGAVQGDHIVITDALEAALSVPLINIRSVEFAAVGCCSAMDDDFPYRPHVVMLVQRSLWRLAERFPRERRLQRILNIRTIATMLRILMFLIIIQPSAAIAGKAYGPYTAELISVYDGDTFTALADIWPRDPKWTEVRIIGIDAPEIRTRNVCEKQLGKKAKARLKSILENANEIKLDEIRRDKYYGRVDARVFVDGNDVARLMIRSGLARPYHGGKRKPWCQDGL